MFLFRRRGREESSARGNRLLEDDSEDEMLIPANPRQWNDASGGLGRAGTRSVSLHFSARSPFERNVTGIDTATLGSLRSECSLQQLIDDHTGDVINVLRHAAVVKLGSFRAESTDVRGAIGPSKMLTNNLDIWNDPFWEVNWSDIIQLKNNRRPNLSNDGWETTLPLTAYAIQIRDIADPKEGDLLALLLKKTASDTAPSEVWTFPAVKAVVQYHWQHWAKKLLFISTALFFLWALCFATYVCFYMASDPYKDVVPNNGTVEANSSRQKRGGSQSYAYFNATIRELVKVDWRHGSFSARKDTTIIIYVLVALCTALMLPFAFEEVLMMFVQREQYISWGNLIDIINCGIQIFISSCHISNYALRTEVFGVLLAIQTVLFSIRILRSFSLLGEGSTFLSTALAVIYSVRYWIAYIIFTAIFTSLCLGALYETDNRFQERHREFSTIQRSFVASVSALFGGYDRAYILDADHSWLKFLFFFALEILMTITVLNLLIAAMSESYISVMKSTDIGRYRGRAQAINELRGFSLRHFLIPKPKKYIHFLVIDDENQQQEFSPFQALLESQAQNIRELKADVQELSTQLKEISELLRRQNPATRGN